MAFELAKAFFGLEVDDSKFNEGLKRAESNAEQTTEKIAGSFNMMAAGIAAAIGVVVVAALEKAIKFTAEYGEEMEHLGDRLGMTAQQASVLTGVLERQGLQGQTAARAFQIMAMQAKATTDALDPFQTKLGRVLGDLRDTQGNLLNTAQVFDLARQKVGAAATETERLQIAQQIFGARMAGQLIPVLKLSNEEWEKQKASVEGAIGPVNQAAEEAMEYKRSSAELDQEIKGLQLSLGTLFLPTITAIVSEVSKGIEVFKSFTRQVQEGSQYIQAGWLLAAEKVGIFNKGTAEAYLNMDKNIQAAKELEEAQVASGAAAEDTEQREQKLVKMVTERVNLTERLMKFGLASQADAEVAAQEKLLQLTQQRLLLESNLAKVAGDNPQAAEIRKQIETEIMKNRVEAAQTTAKLAQDQYAEEESQAKAIGAFNLTTEINLLQKKLSDERIVGDERLKIEAQLYDARKKYLEQAIDVSRKLGIASVDDEINYRKAKASQAAGSGDIIGAAQELIKVRDLAMKQADEMMEFQKKLYTVSLKDEISFQAQKLEFVKGNAEEERKILGQIADLDKQLYEQRLQYAMNYTKGVQDQYKSIMDAAHKKGEVETFEQARVEAGRQLRDTTREAAGVLAGGGTEEQRSAALKFADYAMKQVEAMEKTGKEVTSDWKEAVSVAKDILKSAGVEEVREPGGPTPTVASLLSPMEGLATQGLARGTEIPRLDTSFTDLATRIRDVLLGTIPNLQNFSNAIASSTAKLLGVGGGGGSPALGPGGGNANLNPPLPTGTGTPAPAGYGTATFGGYTSGVGADDPTGRFVYTQAQQDALNATKTQVESADSIKEAAKQFSALADKLQAATDALTNASQLQKEVAVTVSVDPNAGQLLAQHAVNSVTKELEP